MGCIFPLNLYLAICLLCSSAIGLVEPNEVLILVNQQSPTSRYIAKLYQLYHPEINDSQILYLSENPGQPDLHLPDCSGPNSTAADEIITRNEYETLIAKPVRNYLIQNNMVNSIYVIITTAGLPYRIEDTYYSNIITPAGGIVYDESLIPSIDAASVESELTVLFQNDPNNNDDAVTLFDRIVNPYQGYRNSGIELFERDIINRLNLMNWLQPYKYSSSYYPPWMEGYRNSRGVKLRTFSAGDIYMTCRLDGPKSSGQSAIFAVRQILELSKRASDPNYGINPDKTAAIFDDAPLVYNYNNNRIHNLDRYVDYIVWEEGTQQPPNTRDIEIRDDYDSGYEQMTGYVPTLNVLNIGHMSQADDLIVMHDKRQGHLTNQADLGPDELVVALTGFGTNGDEASNKYYLLHGGPAGGPLFSMAYGAVFCSIESFNAVTMFSNVTSAQAKITDFLTIGGCGTIGHTFEPVSDATIDNEFLFYNLLADHDSDGTADLTFIEAAFTAIPYLSWTEVVIGDPLMRIAYGPGGQAQSLLPADIDGDGIAATMRDFALWSDSYLCSISDPSYNDLADLDKDGYVTLKDFAIFAYQYK